MENSGESGDDGGPLGSSTFLGDSGIAGNYIGGDLEGTWNNFRFNNQILLTIQLSTESVFLVFCFHLFLLIRHLYLKNLIKYLSEKRPNLKI